ncbi:MAG: nitrogenase component 1 [Elusimicrobia bacterium]|nr:nitrogenase component 1 [Elusimicrobiota bacterium]
MNSEGHGKPMNFPTLMGVYLAVNAIADAYILVDGPDCVLYKSHFIHGRHDLGSSLLRVSGRHRVAFTNVCSRGVVKEHDEIIRRHLLTLDGLKESGLSFVTALPMCSITGVDYGRVIRSLAGKLSKPAIDIAPDSLIGDWLDGYGQVLNALARGLDLGRRRPARRGPPKKAAIVGYFMDRNEADHFGNLAELRRMLAALGLETVSVWLGGEPAAALRRAAEADLVVSLPYGRTAARALARTAGARLVETELPFGLRKSERFLRDVGKAAGRPRQAEAFIAAELSRVVPRLQWIIPQYFLNRRTAFMGDPYLCAGFLDIAEDLGLEVEGAIVRGQGPAAPQDGRGFPVLCAPRSSSPGVRRIVQAPLDLFVTCWCEQDFHGLPYPVLEFGFPSYRSHALLERPFLGFNGMLGFVERMADKLCAPRRPERYIPGL